MNTFLFCEREKKHDFPLLMSVVHIFALESNEKKRNIPTEKSACYFEGSCTLCPQISVPSLLSYGHTIGFQQSNITVVFFIYSSSFVL